MLAEQPEIEAGDVSRVLESERAVDAALVVIIVAEMFIGSMDGMGHRIIDAQQVFDLQQMYASILMTGGVGYGFNLLFIALEKWVVHWAGR